MEVASKTTEPDIYEKKPNVVHNKLYIQFPCRLPEDAISELKKVDDRIKEVRLPRQKKARFCFLYFANETDCSEVETILRTTPVCGHRLFLNKNRKIDDPEYRQKLKLKSIERKMAKRDAKRLKKQLKQGTTLLKEQKGNVTNKIVVTNIPDNVPESKIKKLFPNFVEFAFREKPRRVCFITFSSTREATKFIRQKPTLDDVQLAVRAAISVPGYRNKLQKRNETTTIEEGDGDGEKPKVNLKRDGDDTAVSAPKPKLKKIKK